MSAPRVSLAIPLKLGGEFWTRELVTYVVDAWLNETSIDEVCIANSGDTPLDHSSPRVYEQMMGETKEWRVGLVRNQAMLMASNECVIQSGAEIMPVGDIVPSLSKVGNFELLAVQYIILLHADETLEALDGRRDFKLGGKGLPPHGIRTLTNAGGCQSMRRTTWLMTKGFCPEISGHGQSNEDQRKRFVKCCGCFNLAQGAMVLHLYHSDRDARHGDENDLANIKLLLKKETTKGWWSNCPTPLHIT